MHINSTLTLYVNPRNPIQQKMRECSGVIKDLKLNSVYAWVLTTLRMIIQNA